MAEKTSCVQRPARDSSLRNGLRSIRAGWLEEENFEPLSALLGRRGQPRRGKGASSKVASLIGLNHRNAKAAPRFFLTLFKGSADFRFSGDNPL